MDIQAALDVLGNPIEKFEARTPTSVSLPFTDLRGARLNGAHLHDANLICAHLDRANLQGADLAAAFLWSAHLEGAHLAGARLKDAHLNSADLRNSVDLTQQQINSACGDKYTALPAGLTPPESWNNIWYCSRPNITGTSCE